MRPRVVVIHPFVQVYRRALYERIYDRLAEQGRDLVVVWNEPPPRLRARGDSMEAEWTRRVPARWIRVGEREMAYRRLGDLRLTPADLVIVEQAVKNLESYPLLLRRRGLGPGVAMWGHGRSFSTTQSAPLAAVKQWLTARSEWFFSYTQAGADHVIEHGFPAHRVSVLNNTIDTGELDARLRDARGVQEYQRLHGLTPGCTALFLGGVDKSKGIDFLLKAAQIAADRLQGFTLLIAGQGDDLQKVIELENKGGPVRALGRVDGLHKAQALAASDVLAIPEWIGLVAVDSLVSRRPIVSTDHHSHSPERGYLVDGVTAVFVEHDPVTYAHALVSLLLDRDRLQAMRAACRADAGRYSLDATVDSFMAGIEDWSEARGRLTTQGADRDS